MVATAVLVMTGVVAGLLLVGLALIRRSRLSATPNPTSSSSGGDSSWMLYSGFSGGESGHGGGSDCNPSDSGTSDAGCGSDGGGGGGDGGGGGSD